MFDFSFGELLVIAVVALVVVGPERLPKVARTAGLLFARAQRYMTDIKSDIQRELQLEELKQLQQDITVKARDLEASFREEIHALEKPLAETTEALREQVDGIEKNFKDETGRLDAAVKSLEEDIKKNTGQGAAPHAEATQAASVADTGESVSLPALTGEPAGESVPAPQYEAEPASQALADGTSGGNMDSVKQ